MPVSDTIGDFLTRLRNGQRAKHKTVDAPASKIKESIAAILKEQGFIADYERINDNVQGTLRVRLRYHNGAPAIREVKRISRPGIRSYAGAEDLPKVYNGLGIAIISTSQGLMTDKQARQKGIGGELLCTLW
jgi:small subunit ribosomal protein S8